MKKYKLVLIEWEDASASSGWQIISKLEEPTLVSCTSVGFVVQETKDLIVIAQSLSGFLDKYFPEWDSADRLTINKSAITKRIELES